MKTKNKVPDYLTEQIRCYLLHHNQNIKRLEREAAQGDESSVFAIEYCKKFKENTIAGVAIEFVKYGFTVEQGKEYIKEIDNSI